MHPPSVPSRDVPRMLFPQTDDGIMTQLPARCYQFDGAVLDPLNLRLTVAGTVRQLEPKSFRLLQFLIENRQRVVTKGEILSVVWEGIAVTDNALTRAVAQVRKALNDDPKQPRFIETIPTVGYRFLAAVDVGPIAEVAPPPEPPRRNVIAWGAGAATLALVGATVFFYSFSKPKLTDKETIVLADFANATGDPVFDGTLRQGLAVQLEQSPFLSLISEEGIEHTLSLMGQAPDARLTPKIAQEICERTGSAAALDGSITSLGSQYVLTLRAKNCRTGELLDEQQVQAARKEDVLNALSQIARKFRARVGESRTTVEKHDTPLAEATTPSLEALKAYSATYKSGNTTGFGANVPLLKRAIELDPKFAMAYALLGLNYSNLGESVLSLESTRKAYELRDRASDREKFFITMLYDRDVTGNLEKARATGELWAQTYPRDPDAHGMLSGFATEGTGRYEQSIEEATKAIELNPDFYPFYTTLAYSNFYLGRQEQAENALRQAEERKVDGPELLILRYYIAFMRSDAAGMKRVTTSAYGRPFEDLMAHNEALLLARSGRLRQARVLSDRAVSLAQRAGQPETAAEFEVGAAVYEAFSGNAPEAKKRAMAALAVCRGRDVEFAAAFALALAGDFSRSQTLANDLNRRFPEDTSVQFNYLPTLRALFALNHKEPAKAIQLLQAAVPYDLAVPGINFFGFFGSLYPAYVRGLAYLTAREGNEAATEFQKILDHGGIVFGDPIGALAHWQLGRAFALSGDKTNAKAAYKDFLNLWRGADPDLPLLKQVEAEYAKLPR